MKYLAEDDFSDTVNELCQINKINYIFAKQHFASLKGKITSLKHLQKILLLENNDEKSNKIKKVYKSFSIWFLKNKAIRVILDS